MESYTLSLNPSLCENNPEFCVDHFKKKEKKPANKYCMKCQYAICMECTFDSHIYGTHEKSDILSIEDFINNGQNDFKKLNESLTKNETESLISTQKSEEGKVIEKKVSELISSSHQVFNGIKSKIENLEEEYTATVKRIASILMDECNSKQQNEYIGNYKKVKADVDRIALNWSSYSRSEKFRYLRAICKIEEDVIKLLSAAEQEIRNQQNSMIDGDASHFLERRIDNELMQLKLESFSTEIENIISHVSNNIQKLSVRNNKDLSCRPIFKVTSSNSNSTSIANSILLIQNSSVGDSHSQEQFQFYVPSTKEDFIAANPKELEYVLFLKEFPVKEVILLRKSNPENPMFIQLDEKARRSLPTTDFKSISLGKEIFISGGKDRSQIFNSCWLIGVDQSMWYPVLIGQFYPMIEHRYQHNLIYLDNCNSILACGGANSKSAEIVTMGSRWQSLPNMNKIRSNGTMFYINQTFVYCQGGYVAGLQSSTDKYHSDMEFIDMKNKEQGWTLLNLDSFTKVDLGLCKMGVIHTSSNKIILVGGDKGKNYQDNAVEIEFINDSPEIRNIIPLGKRLVKGTIFRDNNLFIRYGIKGYNFDFMSKLIVFEAEIKQFIQ